jgi:hypothetical protein
VLLDDIVGEHIRRLKEEVLTSAFGHADVCTLGDNCVVPLYHGVHTPNFHPSCPSTPLDWGHNSMVFNVAVKNKDFSKVDKVRSPKRLAVNDQSRGYI